MDLKKSSYISERIYGKNSKVVCDEKVIEYWKKVIGEEEYKNIMYTYQIDENKLLFSEDYTIDNYTFKALKELESISQMYANRKGQKIDIQNFFDKQLVFENFFTPFIKLGLYILREKNSDSIENCFEKSFATSLLERLSRVSLSTLIFEMYLNKEEGNLKGKNSREEYIYYNDKLLNENTYISSLFEIYPCWERLIYENIYYLTKSYSMLIQRLKNDHLSIVKILCDGVEFYSPVEIKTSISDSHKEGETVAIISLDNGKKIVYKPRSLKAEKAYQNFVSELSSKLAIKLKSIMVLDYKQYGWEEYIEAKSCSTLGELKRYYYRFGVLIFVNYILNANDLHVENVIAMGEYPMVVDAETILDNKRAIDEETARNIINDIIHESVLYSGLLPYYRFGRKGKGVNMSAINGKGGAEYPILLPTIKDAGTSNMRYEYERPVSQENSNLAKLKNDFLEPSQFMEEICAGFSNAYRYMMEHTEQIPKWVKLFSDLEVRHLVQDTQRYSMLLHTSYHPYFMQDGKDRNLFLGCLLKEYNKIQGSIDVVKNEIHEMLHMDIPYFYLNTSQNSLFGASGIEIKNYFPCTSIERLNDKLNSLTFDEMEQQIRFIRIALTDLDSCEKEMSLRSFSILNKINENNSYEFKAIDKITSTLQKTAIYGKNKCDVNWIGISSIGERGNTAWSIRPLSNYFYDGLAGIAVYFAALNKVTGRYDEICNALEKNLFSYTEEICERKDELEGESSGVFNGESGLIYAYQLLYRFTNNKKYLDYAEMHLKKITTIIQKDKDYDVIYGNAGALHIILNMYKLTRNADYMKLANIAGRVLIDGQIKKGEDYGGWITAGSKTPLSGFSHGAAGILWALTRLWKETGNPVVLDTIEKGLRFENHLFDRKAKNWIDRRQRTDEEMQKYGIFMTAWCHGAAGILLSRTKMYGVLPGHFNLELQADASVALDTTLKTGFNNNDCLCHGTLGNTEIILEYCKKFRKTENELQCKIVRNQIAKDICEDNYECGRSYLYGYKIPGFMTGISGMGYSMLRDQDSDLPCILSLDI